MKREWQYLVLCGCLLGCSASDVDPTVSDSAPSPTVALTYSATPGAMADDVYFAGECAYKVHADEFPSVLLVITEKKGIANGRFVLCKPTQSNGDDWMYKDVTVLPGRQNAKQVSMGQFTHVGFIPTGLGDRMPAEHGKHVEENGEGRARNFSSAVWNSGFTGSPDGVEDRINIEIWRRWEGR